MKRSAPVRVGTPAAARFHALDAIAVRAQAVRDPAALFPSVGAALEPLGFSSYIFECDAVGGEVVLRYTSLPAGPRHAIEAALNGPIEGLRLPVAAVPSFAAMLDEGRAIFLEAPDAGVIASALQVARPVVQRMLRALHADRAIIAPLLAGETSLGVLIVHGSDLHPGDIPFMASLGTHIGEALTTVRNLEASQRREAAALALGELSMQVASSIAPAELLALAVRTLRRPLDAAAAAVWLLDRTAIEPILRLAAQEGVPPETLDDIAAIPLNADRLTARVAREQRTLALWSPLTWQEQPETRAVLARAGFGLAITAPLRSAGQLLGVLSLTFKQARPAPADEQAFVEAVATQVAAALENARLLTESRAQATRATLLADLGAMLGGSLDPATLLTTLARRTAEAMKGCAAVYLAHPTEREFEVAAIHHPDPVRLATIRQGLSEIPPRPDVGIFGQSYTERLPLLVRFDDPALSSAQRIYAARVGASSTIAIPLLAHERALGVLAISSLGDDRPYEMSDLALAAAIGGLAAQALDNARSYAEAEEGRRQLTATFESMVECVLVYDVDGCIVDMNEAGRRLLGSPPRDDALHPMTHFIGRFVELRYPDGRLIAPDELPSLRAIGGETVVGFEEIARMLSTGEEMQIVVNTAPLRDERGRLSGAVLVAHDVTALRAAERTRSEFLSVASHELKTPLTPLKGFVQIMSDMVARVESGAPLDHARLQRYLHMMSGRVDRLIELVGTMLDLSRLQVESFALELTACDLVPLAEEVIMGFAREAGSHERARHQLVLDASEPVVARCDAQRIDQVLTNLVANAIKYSPTGGTVRVRMVHEGEQAVLMVEDDGIGIPAGEETALFQPFARGSNAPAIQYGGVGLGLYICREIVERHGGSISAAQRHPGSSHPGTAVRVTLPLAGPTGVMSG